MTAYDQIPYPAAAYSQCHPDRLSMLARLFGMTTPDYHHSRVLELGCADGANLIPMACALPESTFIGVDLSARQINSGQEVITRLGLTNIELRHLDIGEVGEDFGTFDYILAHGVYSWVPAHNQEKILSICSERLSENGVAYISYNTNPGWRMRGMLRDMMLYHSRKFDEPDKQVEQARALINWLGETVESDKNPYGMLLKRELEQMQHWQDTYFRHDSLEEINEPVYFHQFIERAERHGLQYLAEAEFHSMLASNYSEPVGDTLNRLGRDIIEMEQYMDFLRNRMFRQTLLCRRSNKLNRSLGPWSLLPLHVSASLQPVSGETDFSPDQEQSFRNRTGMTLTSSQPLVKAAVVALNEAWPAAITFPELGAKARSLLEAKLSPDARKSISQDAGANQRTLTSVFLTMFTKGLCELHTHPGSFATSPGERPCACPLVRLQATRGHDVTNRRHGKLTLDEFAKQLLPLLDGTRDRSALTKALVDLVAAGHLTVSENDQPVVEPDSVRVAMEKKLDPKLDSLAKFAVLIA